MRRILGLLSALILCSSLQAEAKDVVSEASQKIQIVQNQVNGLQGNIQNQINQINNQVQVLNKPQQILNQVQEIQQQAQQLQQQGQQLQQQGNTVSSILGKIEQGAGQATQQIAGGVSQVLNPVAQTSQQVLNAYNQVYNNVLNAYNQVYNNVQSVIGSFQNIISSVQSIQNIWNAFKKEDNPLKKVYSVLYGIGNITKYLDDINNELDKVFGKILPATHFPPKFFVGLPQVLQIGKAKIKALSTIDVNLNGLDGAGDYLPNQVIQQYCIAHPNNGICSSINNFDIMTYPGATIGKPFIDLPATEIKKNLADAEAVMAAPSQKLSPDGRVLAINKRNQYMMAAVTSTGYLPFGKEVSQNVNVPKALKLKYAEVVGKSAIRDAYIKSFQRRLQVHYQELVRLKALVDQVCSMPVVSPEETCSAGGLGGILGGVGSVFNPLNSLTNLTNITGAIQNIANLPNTITSQIQNVQNTIQNTVGTIQNTVNNVKQKLPTRYIEGRGACCGVCAKALAQAHANMGAIKAGTATVVATIHQAESQLAQVVSLQSCMTRNTIREEQTATRNTIKTYECLLLRIQLRRALIELDQLEAEAANMGANISKLQDSEFNTFEKERKKLIERGLR